MNQEKNPENPENTTEAGQHLVAGNLDEVDFLKLRLLNRNVDYFTAQAELTQMQSMEASRALMAFSNIIMDKYNVNDPRQIDVHTGKIVREATPENESSQ